MTDFATYVGTRRRGWNAACKRAKQVVALHRGCR